MEKHKFKVGDRVKVKNDTVTINRRTIGKCGTVKELLTNNYCAVEFDKFVGGHDCNGFAKEGHGWNFKEDVLDLVETQNETIVIYRKDNKVIALDKSTGEKAEAKCNPADEFDFRTGAKLAFNRLMGEDNGVREVNRKAKVGDYIKIVFPILELGRYLKGDVLKVTIGADSTGCFALTKNKEEIYIGNLEYVVLENYKPEEKAQEKDDSVIHVGDMVQVTNSGDCYSTYRSWSGLRNYVQNYVDGVTAKKGMVAKVLNIAKHDDSSITRENLALIQNPNTSQVFIISYDGIKKVER